MNRVREWINRMAGMFRTGRSDAELEEELATHVEMLVEQNMERGMTAEGARRAAWIALGGGEQIKDAVRQQRGLPWLESLIADVRFGLRMLRKNPGFTAVAVLTLALGIGANTAIFSAVNGIVLKRLPYADASQLVSVAGVRRFAGGIEGTMNFTPGVWKQVKEQTPAIARMALYENQTNMTLTGGKIPEVVPVVGVSSDFFPLIGARPFLGRPILTGDTKAGSKPVAVLSYVLWHGILGGDPSVTGRTLMLDDKTYEVIGVMPPDFTFPIWSGAEGIWIPLIENSNDAAPTMAVARLQPDVSIRKANAELKTISTRLAAHFHGFGEGGYFYATGLKLRLGDLNSGMQILLGAVGFVLLIACVNVSGLLLARGWTRQRELAVREALGASRLRILRQLLTESVLLAFAAGALGLVLAVLGVRVLRAIAPEGTQEHGKFLLDAHILWFAIAISLIAGTLFGLAPAVQISARRIGAGMRESMSGAPGALSSRRTRRARSFLAAAEIAIALILVVGATLAARSFEKLTSVTLGFRTDHIMTMNANFNKSICGWKRIELPKDIAACWLAVNGVLSNMRAIPGVLSAAAVSDVPLVRWSVAPNVQIEGQSKELSLGSNDVIADRMISPDYFRTLDIRLLSGREFLGSDTSDGSRVAIVDESFARKYLGDHPLGQRISHQNDANGKPEWMEIVGVVSPTHDLNPSQPPRAEIYIPFAQETRSAEADFIVRTAQDPAAMTPALENAIWAVDKNTPIRDLTTMDELVAVSIANPRFEAILLGAFGGLGLVLAIVGVYGVISYGVSQRTREIGVRMALGAGRRDVLRMVLREGMLLAITGIVVGIGGAFALTRFLRSLLFEIKPTDPATFVGVAVALLLVAMAACYVPARRAMRVDPMVALRHE